jgi:hypothetical protein
VAESARSLTSVGTKLERATGGTIRLQLLKIGALVTVTVRRVKVAFASAYPWGEPDAPRRAHEHVGHWQPKSIGAHGRRLCAIGEQFPLAFFSEPPIPSEIDLGATDDPLYGQQEGRHFHSYYDCYCYPCRSTSSAGRHLLAAKLWSSSVDARTLTRVA